MQTNSPTPTAAELAVLDSVITAVARSRRMRREDAEDFRQTVHLRLAERDGDIFRRFSGRSSLKTYLMVVVQRLLLDARTQALGKWRPSAAARRLGPVAVSLDRLVYRDAFTVDQAAEHVCSRQRELDPREVRRLAAALPPRLTRRAALKEHALAAQVVEFGDPVEARQRTEQAGVYRAALARALAALDPVDRNLIRLRYVRQVTVRRLAGILGTDAKSLYRRFDRILLVLRRQLAVQGINGPVALP